MDQLVERVLTVGARLAPDDWASLVIHRVAVTVNVLAVGFHVALLEVGRKAVHVLVVRQNRFGFSAEEVVVPDPDQRQQHRQVFSGAVVEKCLSIACAPESSSTKLSKPTDRMMDRPIADHRE